MQVRNIHRSTDQYTSNGALKNVSSVRVEVSFNFKLNFKTEEQAVTTEDHGLRNMILGQIR